MDAIRYSSFKGGKKVRPALVYAVAQTIDLPLEKVDDIACAIELIHTYSMIHDDLPAMDDDELRRGYPTLHRAFDEAVAILAGDAMQALAFEVLTLSPTLSDQQKVKVIQLLAAIAGTEGMAGGQTLDMVLTGETPDIDTVETIHRLKTGSLMSACIRMPLACSDGHDDAVQNSLENYADQIGLIFQIRDDILDLHTDTANENKPTYPAVLGLEGAKRELQRGAEQCLANLETLGAPAQPLRLLTRYIAVHES